jgi:hypothetical protein
MVCKELLSTGVFIYHILHVHVNLLCPRMLYFNVLYSHLYILFSFL